MAKSADGPVGEFCAALRELQLTSGVSRTVLARQLNYGRSQLYEILDGRIKRPPEWAKVVEPLLRACLSASLGRTDLERAVADWRHRHEVLLRVHDELSRRVPRTATEPAAPEGASAGQALLVHSGALWPRLTGHPFVRAVAEGRLADEVFRRWLVNDHYYNVEYQRFIAGLAGIAPTDAATELIGTAITGSRLGLLELRRLAERFVVDLCVEPGSVTVGLAAYLQSQVSRGYETSVVALYAAERVYFDIWSAVRPTADRSTPYWQLVDYWSSPTYEHWIAGLGRLVDVAAPAGPTPDMYRTFDRVLRWELLFFTALLTGDDW